MAASDLNARPVPADVEAGLQTLLFTGYSWLPYGAVVGVCFHSATSGRTWIEQVRDEVCFGPPRRTQPLQEAVQLALTAHGLRLVAPGTLEDGQLGEEFADGMTGPASRARLGDAGVRSPWRWSDRTFHALMFVYAGKANAATRLVDELTTGVSVVFHRAVHAPAHQREPFGFRDGIAQVRLPRAGQRNPSAVPAGELVLGLQRAELPAQDLSGVGRYGSFVVVRELDQDVERFWRIWLERADHDEERAILLASKAVGRWPNGMPVRPDEVSEPTAVEADIQSLSFLQDARGEGCPFGAHVRRANPRETLTGDAELSMRMVRQRQLMRRGRVYGAPPSVAAYPSALQPLMADSRCSPSIDGAHGLLFVAICADLRGQFEFLQQNWLLAPKFADLYGEIDPLLAPEEASTSLTIPTSRFSHIVGGLGGFVSVRAGGYALLLHRAGFDALLHGAGSRSSAVR